MAYMISRLAAFTDGHWVTSPSTDRVHGPQGINLNALQCPICHNLLWRPRACAECETAFCGHCLEHWYRINPNRCPMRCRTHSNRPCPKFILEELSRIRIACIYQPKYCSEILSYEALEAHEIQCGQQMVRCLGCQVELEKRDLPQHEYHCEKLKLTCPDCHIVYENELPKLHTETACLKQQNKQLRQELEGIKEQIKQIKISNNLLLYKLVNFSDLINVKRGIGTMPTHYNNLQWINLKYIYLSYGLKSLPRSGFPKIFASIGNSYILYSDGSASITSEDMNKTFSIAWLAACAIWNENLHLTIKGYRKGEQFYTHTILLLFGEPQQIHLCWTDVDTIKLKSHDGNLRRGTSLDSNDTFALISLFIDLPS